MPLGFSASIVRVSAAFGPAVPTPPSNISLPTLVGGFAVGEQVVFNAGGWSGYPAPSYTYQLKRGGVNVAGTSPYTWVAGDYGATFELEVSATNAAGGPVVATSVVYGPIAGVLPTNTVAPALTGSTGLGAVLSSSTGTWSGYPASFTYERKMTRNGADIPGATGATYTITAADSGAALGVLVRATNAQGPSDWVASNTITAQTFTVPSNTVAPVASGSNGLGSVLSVTNGTWTGNPGSFTYERKWVRGVTDIPGATGATYTITAADSGAGVTPMVRATNAIGTSGWVAGNTTTVQTFTAPSISGVPTVSGVAEVGEVLTATPASVTGNPSPTRTWVWLRDDVAIGGATLSTYTLVGADADTLIAPRQVETNAIGTDQATATAVGPIVSAVPANALSMDDLILTMDDEVLSMETAT